MSFSRVVVGLGCLIGALAAAPAAHAASSFCADTGTAPCIQSAMVNGSPVTLSDPDWALAVTSASSPSNEVRVNVTSKTNSDPYELGSGALGDDWVIVLDVGSVVPRVAFARGDEATFIRDDQGDGTYLLEIHASPVTVTSGCTQVSYPWSCPSLAADDRDAYLDASTTDYAAWENVRQRRSFWGMNYATNVDATSIPPQVIEGLGGTGLLIDLANSHFRADGTTVFTGFARLRIPNFFLRAVYGIDDPSTLTPSGIHTSTSGGSGGSGTTSILPTPSAVLVEIDDMTFSHRRVRVVRGNIRPARARVLRAKRLGAGSAKLVVRRAKPRGSKLKRTVVRCAGAGKRLRRGAKPRATRIKLRGLRPGAAYTCRVRAVAKAGPGRWSRRVRIPASP